MPLSSPATAQPTWSTGMIDWRNPFSAADQNLSQSPQSKARETAARTQQAAAVKDLASLQLWQNQMQQAAKRTCDYHRANLKTAGFDDLAEGPCVEDMGDITSIGEQHVTYQQQKSAAPLWLTALGASLATAVICGLLFWVNGGGEDTNTDTTYEYGVESRPRE